MKPRERLRKIIVLPCIRDALLLSVLLILFCPGNVLANGIGIYGLSAQGQARGEAVVASINDPSAVWYNPALMTRLAGREFSLYANNKFISTKFRDLSGREETNRDDYFFIPALYLTGKMMDDRLSLGFGVNAPYGLSSRYSKQSNFRYIATEGEIVLLNISPAVAYQFTDRISGGIGLNYYKASANLTRQYPWAAVESSLGMPAASPDGTSSLEGHGDGLGFNVGLHYAVSEKHAFGAVYRSQVKVDFKGKKAGLTGIPPALQGLFSGSGVYSTGVKTSFTFPDSLALGYAFTPDKRWTWEMDWMWWDWSDFQAINVDIDREIPGLFPDLQDKAAWRDGWAIAAGVRYLAIPDRLDLGFGYQFSNSPINETFYTPLIPELDFHVFSLGVSYRIKGLHIEIPFAVITSFGNRKIDSQKTDPFGVGQTTDGLYRLMDYEFGIKLSMSF